MTIETKFNIDDGVYVLIEGVMYRMIIEKCKINFTNNDKHCEEYTLIHKKSDYNNKKTFSAKDVHKTIEDLREYEILKANSYVLNNCR